MGERDAMAADIFGDAPQRRSKTQLFAKRVFCRSFAVALVGLTVFADVFAPTARAQTATDRGTAKSLGDLLARGRTALKAGRAKDALRFFDSVLIERPGRSAGYSRGGRRRLIYWVRLTRPSRFTMGCSRKGPKTLRRSSIAASLDIMAAKFDQAETDIRSAIAQGLKLAIVYQRLGDVHYARGDLKTALKLYLQALDSKKPDPSIHRMLGSTHYGLGDYKSAEISYTEALRLNPVDGYAAYYRAWTREKLKRPLKALQDYDRAFEILGGQAPRVAIDRGRMLLRRGALAAALADFRVALDREPENPAALYGAARTLVAQGQTTAALEVLNRLVGIVGDNRRLGAAALFLRARAKIANEDFAGALADLDLSISVTPAPGDADAFFNRALVRSKLNDAAGALEDLRAAAKIKPNDAQIQYALARAAIVAGLGDLARSSARKAESLAARSAVGPKARAVTLLALDQPKAALRELGAYLQRAPRDTEAMRLASLALLRVGRHADALILAQRIGLYAPRNPSGPMLEAQAYIALSDPKRARDALNRANALGASLTQITSLAGKMWIMVSQMDPSKLPAMHVDGRWALEQAGAAYDMAVEHSKRSPETLKERARVRIMRGDHKGALEDLTRAIGERPQDASLRFARADLLRKLKRCEEAIKDYDTVLSLQPDNSDARSDRADCKFDEGSYLGAIGDYVGSWF